MAASLGLVTLTAPLALGYGMALASDSFACPKDAPPRCESARSSLKEAQSAVEAAASARALWTTAVEALREAQGAFLRGDYEGAQGAADIAAQQARLGIAQSAYPILPFPSH
jgi:hypothetical protein